MATLNVLTICGSLRKGSFNAMVQRALPALAPEGMSLKPAPSFAEFPIYNADIQNSTGFPPAVNALADAIRAADGVIFCTPEYNFTIPGRPEERARLGVAAAEPAVRRQAGGAAVGVARPGRRRPRSVRPAQGA